MHVKIGLFHNSRNTSSRLLTIISKNLNKCMYLNLTIYNLQYPSNINSYYKDGSVPSSSETTDTYQPIVSTTPSWKNITISNLTATWDSTRASYNSSAASNSYCGVIWGLPE